MADSRIPLPSRREILAGLLAMMSVHPFRGPGKQERLSRSVATYLSRLEGFGFAGAVLVGRETGVLAESVHGLADPSTGVAWRGDTIFDTGSVTKQFTAAAILALVTDGRLAASDPVGRHLPNVPADKSAITIHHLLTHTSGLENGFGSDYEVVSRDELVARAMQSALRSVPGERHAYSNAGYSLLAAIVEIASGRSYDAFLRERLFLRSGMTSSGYELSLAARRRLARGYRDGEDARLPEAAAVTAGVMWNLIGNGGLYSTIRDLHRWMIALQNDSVLPASARQELFRPQVVVTANYRNSGAPLHYGYGWYVLPRPSGGPLVWHYGGNGITNCAIRYHVGERTVVVYGSNVSEFHDPNDPVPAVERMLVGSPVEAPPRVVSWPASRFGQYAGRYRAPTGSVLAFEARRGALELTAEGQEAYTYLHGGGWHGNSAFDALNTRTLEAVETSRARRWDALARLFPSTTAVGELEGFETMFWKRRHDSLGAYTGVRLMGTMPGSRRFTGRTIVVIDFERGPVFREYFWLPDGTIGDLGPLRSPPLRRCFPVSDDCVAALDLAADKSLRLCFEIAQNEVIVRIPEASVLLRRES